MNDFHNSRWPFVLFGQLFLLLVCFVAQLFLTQPVIAQSVATDDWIGRVVELAGERYDRPFKSKRGSLKMKFYPSHYEPRVLTDPQKLAIALDGLSSERTPDRRMACLKILVERFPLAALEKIESIANNGSLDIEIRRRATWIAGIMRQESSIVWLEKLLENMEPSIREAAIDSLGFCLFPHYTRKFRTDYFSDPKGVYIGGKIPIFVRNTFRLGVTDLQAIKELSNRDAVYKLEKTFVGENQKLALLSNQSTRQRLAERLTRIMLAGETPNERLAAARALAGYTPEKYQLRVAEWGVWIESDGKLQLAKTVLDEIPPIAYQTTKQIAELKKRVAQIMVVTKPIIHLKADRPLSVNVTAFIRKGQPWFTYPQPSSFDLQVYGTIHEEKYGDPDFRDVQQRKDENSTRWKSFGEQAHEGYPFLFPKSSQVGSGSGTLGAENMIQAIGVKWQHLVVSPKLQDWMVPQSLPEKYRWWTDLRKVDASWVSNGFESEKFLYYDGPTLLPSPIRVETAGEGKNRELTFRYFATLAPPFSSPRSGEKVQKPSALLVEVKDEKIVGRRIEFEESYRPRKLIEEVKRKLRSVQWTMLIAKHSVDNKFDLRGDEVKQEFLAMLKKNGGLTDEESQGLFQAWEKQFFKTNGKRLILRLRRLDYDFQCPLEVTPKPSQVARVGLVLSELKE